MIHWRLYAWQSGEKLYRHWFDLELSTEWARRFVRARSLFEQLYCWARWIEAANLGAYQMMRMGADPTAAPLASLTEAIPGDTRRGVPFPPGELAEAIPAGERGANYMDKIYRQSMGAQIRRTFDFGAILRLEPNGMRVARDNPPFTMKRIAVLDSMGQNQERFERRLAALLSDAGNATAAVTLGTLKANATRWFVWPLPVVRGLSIAVQWTGDHYRVLYVDENEQRQRASLAFGDLARDFYVEAFEDSEALAYVPRARWAPAFLPDIEHRRAEAGAFAANPFAWLQRYTDGIIARNAWYLRNVNPALASRADAASRDGSAAAAISQIALANANASNRDALQGQLRDAAGLAENAPLVGEIASTLMTGVTALFRAVGALDLPEAERQAILRDTIALLPIGGVASADPARARPPSHGVVVPSGWSRTAARLPAGVVVVGSGDAAPMRTAGPDPTAEELTVVTTAHGELNGTNGTRLEVIEPTRDYEPPPQLFELGQSADDTGAPAVVVGGLVGIAAFALYYFTR